MPALPTKATSLPRHSAVRGLLECLQCGNRFRPYRPQQKYCRPACAQSAAYEAYTSRWGGPADLGAICDATRDPRLARATVVQALTDWLSEAG